IDVLGPGVVAVVIERVREQEHDLPGLAPYFDGLEGEVRLAQGDSARALVLARKALDGLPKAEALLAARAAAVGAHAAARTGDGGGAVALFHRAMLLDPGVVRRLGLSLPATVAVQGGDPALERAAVLLRRSPRLRDGARGFEVLLDQAGTDLRACMRAPDGTV